jgi:hypothetical protein
MFEKVEKPQDDDRAEFEKLLVERLWDEYRILQDKIDKIGAFKFTIRGWSITLVIASSVGAATAKLSSNWILLCSIPFLISFGFMEQFQIRNRDVFSKRCSDIEGDLWRLMRKMPGSGAMGIRNTPRIARSLHDSAPKRSGAIGKASRWFRSYGRYFLYAFEVAVVFGVTLLLQFGPREAVPITPPVVVNVTGPEPKTTKNSEIQQEGAQPNPKDLHDKSGKPVKTR